MRDMSGFCHSESEGKILMNQSWNCCSELQGEVTDGLFYHVSFLWLSSKLQQIFGIFICPGLVFKRLKYKCLKLSSTILSQHLWSLRSVAAYCDSAMPKILPHLYLYIKLGVYTTFLSGACKYLSALLHGPEDPWGGEVTVVQFVLNAVN